MCASPAAPTDQISPAQAKTIIVHRAERVILAVKSKNMATVASLVHPERGVRFSPYEHVDTGRDRVLKRDRLNILWTSEQRYVWGRYDGSGEPIRLTFRAYYRRFVYDRDYAKARNVGFNDAIMGHGNTRNNIHEVYRRAIVVEYYFPGSDPQYAGIDWRSLWLIFEKMNQTWYLVGIVHGAWTI